MPNNWKKYKLIDIIDLIGGGTPKTSIKEYWDGDIPWLSVVDFNNGQKRVYDTEKKITEAGLKNSSTKMLNKGQLIISARGTVGVLSQLGRDMTFNQSCYGLDAKSDFTTNDYLYYLVGHNINQIKANAYGSVFDTITRSTFEKIDILLPPLPEQQAIAEILSALDDKIELNLQTNKTLEDMANALYKDWFVDFGPFKNGKFIESELGLIPVGWEVKEIGQIADIIDPHPSHRAPEMTKSGYPFAGIGDIDEDGTINHDKARTISEEFVTHQEKSYSLGEFSIGYGRVGTVGKVVKLRKQKYRYAISPTLAILNPKTDLLGEFLFYCVKDEGFYKKVESNLTGSTRPTIGIQTLRKIKIAFPKNINDPILAQFKFTAENWFKLTDSISKENIFLKQTRDYLLPKLISGEIRVKEAHKKVKDLV